MEKSSLIVEEMFTSLFKVTVVKPQVIFYHFDDLVLIISRMGAVFF